MCYKPLGLWRLSIFGVLAVSLSFLGVKYRTLSFVCFLDYSFVDCRSVIRLKQNSYSSLSKWLVVWLPFVAGIIYQQNFQWLIQKGDNQWKWMPLVKGLGDICVSPEKKKKKTKYLCLPSIYLSGSNWVKWYLCWGLWYGHGSMILRSMGVWLYYASYYAARHILNLGHGVLQGTPEDDGAIFH